MTQPQTDKKRFITAWLSSIVDLPTRQRLEEELGMFEAIVAFSNDAIVSKTLDGIITSWNQAAEDMFGYSAQEAIGQHITLIIRKKRRSSANCARASPSSTMTRCVSEKMAAGSRCH
jgi:PAS domain-containing protein